MSYQPPASQPAAPYTTPAPQAAPAAYQADANAYQADQTVYAPQAQALPTTLAYTNTYALLAIIFAFIAPVAGIIFGHLGLKQIKNNGDAGRGIALTGLILGYAYVALIGIILITYVGLIFVMFASVGAAMDGFDSFS